MRKWIYFVMAIVICFTMLTGCAESNDAKGGVLYLRVNPQFAVHFDADNKVTKVEALNDDGAKLLNALSPFEEKSISEIVGELVKVIDEAGYFDGGAEVSVSIESEKEENIDELLTQTKDAIENYAKEKEMTISVTLTHGEETETFEVNESSEESSAEESSAEESSTIINTYEENGVTWTRVNESVWTSCTANIRKGPGTNFDKVGMVYYCNQYTRTDIGSNGWSKIVVNGEEVYVMSEYLTYTKPTDYEVNEDNAYHDDTTDSDLKEEPNWIATNEIMYTNGHCLAFVGSDCWDSDSCLINPNTEVLVIGKTDEKYKFKYNGQVLYTWLDELTSTPPDPVKYCDACGLQSELRGEELWCSRRDKDRYCGTCGEFVSANACHSCSASSEGYFYCSDCGRKSGFGPNGTCVQYINDRTCSYCGDPIYAHTCHTCTKGCAKCGKPLGDGRKGTCARSAIYELTCSHCGKFVPVDTCHTCS